MSDAKRRKRRLGVLLATAAVLFAASDAALFTVGHAAQDDTQAPNYDVYNGQVSAAADLERVTTEKDVGIPCGAVCNSYPDTKVSVALAGTHAEASPADTGPLVESVVAGQNVSQPQYVFANYPGTQNPPGYRVGPATADASVTPASAVASGTYGAVGSTTTAPLSSHPDGSDGGSARSTSYFDSTLGFVTTGDARVHHASYGGGMLQIDNVHLNVTVSTKGANTFSKTISITVGSAFVNVNGNLVAVTIDQNGVTVQDTNNSTPTDLLHMVSDQVNGALSAAGISVHTVTPLVTPQGNNLHIEAEGLVVDVKQTGTPDGVPRQTFRHVLGEVVMDNEAVLAPPPVQDVAPLPTPVDTGSVPTEVGPSTNTTTIITNVAPSSAPPPPAPAPIAATPRIAAGPVSVLLSTPKPRWLLFGYLAWQALLLALAGALYLQRSALRRTR